MEFKKGVKKAITSAMTLMLILLFTFSSTECASLHKNRNGNGQSFLTFMDRKHGKSQSIYEYYRDQMFKTLGFGYGFGAESKFHDDEDVDTEEDFTSEKGHKHGKGKGKGNGKGAETEEPYGVDFGPYVGTYNPFLYGGPNGPPLYVPGYGLHPVMGVPYKDPHKPLPNGHLSHMGY